MIEHLPGVDPVYLHRFLPPNVQGQQNNLIKCHVLQQDTH
jgi:hypothetical protein